MDQNNQQNFDDQSDQSVSNNNLVAPPATPSAPPAIQLSNLPDDLNSVIGHNNMPVQAVSDPAVPTGVAQPPANTNQTPLATPAVTPSPLENPVVAPPPTSSVEPSALQQSSNANFIKDNIFTLLGLSFGVVSPLIFFLLSSGKAIALILAIAGLLLSIFDFSSSKKKIALIGIVLNALMIVGVIVFLILNTRSTSKIINSTETETTSDTSTEQTIDSSDSSQTDSASTSDQSSDTSTSTTDSSSSSSTATQSTATNSTSGTVTTALESKPYTSTKGGFEITPPSGWTVDASGAGGTLVTFKNPNSDKSGGSTFYGTLSVLTPTSTGSSDLTAFVQTIKSSDAKSLTGFEVVDDKNTDNGYLMGGTFTQGSFQLRNLHMLGVYNGNGYNIVCTGTVTNWDKYNDICQKSFMTYTLTGN